MKLTAEQKQLFHECVDLGLELTEHNKRAEVVMFIDNEEPPLINVRNLTGIDGYLSADSAKEFTISQLQQAKDYLTKLLVGKATLIKAFDRCLSHEECVELTK